MTTILTVFLTNGQHIVEKFTHLKRTEAIKLARTIAKEGYGDPSRAVQAEGPG